MRFFRKKSDLPRRWQFFAAAACFLLLSACSLFSRGEEERQAEFQRHFSVGEAAWQMRNYPAAVDAYAQAHLLTPDDGPLAYRLGYGHEVLGNYAAAASTYRQALLIPRLAADLQHDLTYRLALLEAFRTDGAARLPGLLASLPPATAYAADLRAVEALLAGDGRKALAALNQARLLPLPPDMSSTIYYHAARAYYLTGEFDRAMQNLYEAINRSESVTGSRDIGEFRDLLLSQKRP